MDTLQSLFSHSAQFVSEVTATLVDIVVPRSLSRHILPQVDHYAPHASTGFEGWYTRIQGDGFSMAFILCSLGNHVKGSGEKQHYLHFSLVPLRTSSSPDSSPPMDPIELHIFPERIVASSKTPGSLPFQLDVPGFGSLVVHPDRQIYNFVLPIDPHDPRGPKITVNITITGRKPLNPGNLLETPHGSFARLQNTLPLHWGIFSVLSHAEFVIVRSPVPGVSPGQRWRSSGRAHLEKNWGVSFPEGWTWLVRYLYGLVTIALDLTHAVILKFFSKGLKPLRAAPTQSRSPSREGRSLDTRPR